jgi:hypothetical protein
MIPSYAYQGPVLDLSALRYDPCHDWIFPSIIRAADHIASPLGRYYLYYAPHDAPGGLCLAYADAVGGPWTEYAENPIVARTWLPHHDVSHISSPHVLWMPDEQKYFLYYHGENDTTRLATSQDGIHFTYEGEVVTTAMYDGITESSYARVFPCRHATRGACYVMLFMGNNAGTRRIYAAWSQDGRTFESQRTPLINPPPGTNVTQVGAPWYFAKDGRHFVIFHGDQTDARLNNVITDMYLAEVGADFTEEKHLGFYYRREEVSPENMRASDPCLFQDGEDEWLFMSVGARLDQHIAAARRRI